MDVQYEMPNRVARELGCSELMLCSPVRETQI